MARFFTPSHSRFIGLSLVLAATLFVAADQAIDPAWMRLEALPQAERLRLWENLQRFDKLARGDQNAVKELDRRVAEIDNAEQKAHYLSVMRRYHLWFDRLPEAKRDELLKSAPDDRMARVSQIMAEQKAAGRAGSPLHLLPRIADLGAFSPVDMAMIYRTWQGMNPAERADLEKLPPPQFRNQISRRSSKSDVTPAELLPAKYKEADWVAKVEKHPRFLRVDSITKGKAALRDEKRRHMALNLYFLEHPPKAVSDAHLAQFLNEFPAVVRSTFDVFPPEEIKRRLSTSYRMVFPNDEIPPPRKGVPAGAANHPAVKPGPVPAPPTNPASPNPAPAVKPETAPAAPSRDVPF
jgi:hypothetical protein